MANDLNQCNFIGRLGRDPEVRYTPTGTTVTTISLAVGKMWKDKNGQKQENTEWVRVVAFARLSEVMAEYLGKGSRIFVSGEMRTRKWQDQQGQDRYSTEVVAQQMQMLDTRRSEQQTPVQGPAPQHQGAIHPAAQDDYEDDIPF